MDLRLVSDWKSFRPEQLAAMIREHDILIASRAPVVPEELATDPGRLKYICYLHGTMRKVIGLAIIRSSIVITNWGDSAGRPLAEGSLALLLAVFRDLPRRILAVRAGAGRGICSMGSAVSRLNVGVYGYGFAGREFVKLLRPFGSTVRVFDPYVENIPDDCIRVTSLDELFASSQAIVIHAGLTDQTRESVSSELLAKLPDQGIVINTARGAIIDQDALFNELRAGRLRAGLDVLWPDDLPADHEARQWQNLIWTCHEFGGRPWPDEQNADIRGHFRIHLDNIRAFVQGEPLQFVVDETRYSRMT
jgi:phosphoglycerate dehydrogenase-like enzyme